jgi:hypothetical protein
MGRIAALISSITRKNGGDPHIEILVDEFTSIHPFVIFGRYIYPRMVR